MSEAKIVMGITVPALPDPYETPDPYPHRRPGARLRQITHPDLPPRTATPVSERRAPTAPERTISGGRPISTKLVRGMVEQQKAADECMMALGRLSDGLAELG